MRWIPSWRFFPFGFVLSIPLVATAWWAFSLRSISNDQNNLFLGVMFVIGVLSLPGSAVLFMLGFSAAFAGPIGGAISLMCMALSVANAHLMAMIYARALLAILGKKS